MAIENTPKITQQTFVNVTPTISTTPYSANDQVGGIMTLTDAIRRSGILTSIAITDQSAQSAAFDILFFNTLPTVASVDNGALNISDAEVTAKCLGHVSVSTYTTTSANAVGTATNLNLPVEAAGGTTIYAVAKTTGTPTYALSALTFKFKFLSD